VKHIESIKSGDTLHVVFRQGALFNQELQKALDAAWRSDLAKALAGAGMEAPSVWNELFEDALGGEGLIHEDISSGIQGEHQGEHFDDDYDEKLRLEEVTLNTVLTRDDFELSLQHHLSAIESTLKETWSELSNEETKPYQKQTAADLATAFQRIPIEKQRLVEDSSKDEDALLLLDLLHAPRGTKLAGLAMTLTRAENLSHILAFTKRVDGSGEFRVDLLEMPRIAMSFKEKIDEHGITRLYSEDHADLYLSNMRSKSLEKLIQGIPHCLLFANSNDQVQVLIPAWKPVRPAIQSAPLHTELVLDRNDPEWSAVLERPYYLYPVHVSTTLLFMPTLSCVIYLQLLRFLHRNYEEVFRMADAIATDTAYSSEEGQSFKMLALCNGDRFPDAHVCRLKISLVTLDSPISCPWDVTKEMHAYTLKLNHTSAACRLSRMEELQLLSECITELTDPRLSLKPVKYTEYEACTCGNRQRLLRALEGGGTGKVQCILPTRKKDQGWHSSVTKEYHRRIPQL